MKLSDVRDVLTAISGYDRKPFPDGADVAWLEVLAGIDARDAHRAVVDHYAVRDARPMQPGDVRAGARRLAEMRTRAQRVLPAAPVQTDRAAMAREVIRELTAAAEARYREEHPDAPRYQHRRTPATRVRTSA